MKTRPQRLPRRQITFVLVGLLAVGCFLSRSRPSSRLQRLGFPALPQNCEVLATYSLSGFSTVYMVMIALPPAESNRFTSAFAWERKEIGRDSGEIIITIPETFDAVSAAVDLEVEIGLRENYPETFAWWTPQSISDGVMFRRDGDGVMRRAYIDHKSSVAYLFFQRS